MPNFVTKFTGATSLPPTPSPKTYCRRRDYVTSDPRVAHNVLKLFLAYKLDLGEFVLMKV